MSHIDSAIQAGDATSPAEVKAWDPFVRVFHWSLVTLFVAAHVTGDEFEDAHYIIGYTIAGLLAARVVWGIVGGRHARFTDFVRGPFTILAYLRDVAMLRSRRYLGHNPAGGAMVVALLLSLSATCLTGYLMTTPEMWGSKWLEDVHEATAHLTIVLVALHVLGVIVTSFMHGENLVRSMITGRKRAE